MPHVQKHEDTLPQPRGPLPELTSGERLSAHRGLRLVKKGRLYSVTFRLHKVEECLDMSWAEDGGGKLCK